MEYGGSMDGVWRGCGGGPEDVTLKCSFLTTCLPWFSVSRYGSVAVGTGRGSEAAFADIGGQSDRQACCYGDGIERLRCNYGVLADGVRMLQVLAWHKTNVLVKPRRSENGAARRSRAARDYC
jgi:hypothetical protein